MRITPVGVAVPAHAARRGWWTPSSRPAGSPTTPASRSPGRRRSPPRSAPGWPGAALPDSLRLAVAAARVGGRRGHYVAGADVAARIEWALGWSPAATPADAVEIVYRLVGTGVATQESVPAALAVASLFPDDAWAACRHAASLGGDCDTIAAMAGAVVGAHVGVDSVPAPDPRAACRRQPRARRSRRLAATLLDLRAAPSAGTGWLSRRGCSRWAASWSTSPSTYRRCRSAAATCWPAATRTLVGGGFNLAAAVARQDVPCGYARAARHRAPRRPGPGRAGRGGHRRWPARSEPAATPASAWP